jgi:undecaprenyl-diphosphatase
MTAINATLSLPTGLQGIDEALLVWMNALRHPLLDRLFGVVTWAGSLYVLLPLSMAVLAFMLVRKRWPEAELFGLGFGGAVMATNGIKWLVGRPRPDLFPSLVPMPPDFSFPSGHTAQITAFACCLSIIASRCRGAPFGSTVTALAALITGLVGFSRLYLQVHFLSDVLAGALLSLLWVGSIQWILGRTSPPAP